MLKPVSEIIPHIFDGEDLLMPEGKIENEEKAPRIDWEHNAMRAHSLLDIQSAIAKALSELTGEKLAVSVMNLDFVPAWAGASAAIAGSTECVLRIRPARPDGSVF
jgi:hypothetical protein